MDPKDAAAAEDPRRSKERVSREVVRPEKMLRRKSFVERYAERRKDWPERLE
jgi:hypothetical protein